MKQYLNMADVFDLSVMDAGKLSVKTSCVWSEWDDSVTPHEYAAHAINSHDELVQINQELLAALEAVMEWYDMEADHSIEPNFYKRMAACKISEDMAREAIAKAKGGAA